MLKGGKHDLLKNVKGGKSAHCNPGDPILKRKGAYERKVRNYSDLYGVQAVKHCLLQPNRGEKVRLVILVTRF